jgi:hypothetical protein
MTKVGVAPCLKFDLMVVLYIDTNLYEKAS